MTSEDQLRAAYRVLELHESATLADVREAYRVLSRVWHPDRFAGTPRMVEKATARQQELNAAYQRLLAAYSTGAAPFARTAGAPDHGEAAAGAARDASHDQAIPERWQETLRRRILMLAVAVAAAALVVTVFWLAFAGRGAVIRSADGARVTASLLAAGGGHACAAAASDVYCWGDNHAGQAGAGPADQVRRAVKLTLPEPVRMVAAGLTHSCALLAGGAVQCWGGNHSAQLGDGTLVDRNKPGGLALDLEFTAVSSLSQHTCATTIHGALYCWGSDADGQLGIGAPVAACALDQARFHCSDRPERVAGDGWQSVSAGGSHTCGVDAGGGVLCWGSNRHGQLGASASEQCRGPGGSQPCRRRPAAVPGPAATTAVAAGAAHTCALDNGGGVSCWGLNTFGQTGAATDRSGPLALDAHARFRALAAGAYHTCAISDDGALWCWGRDGSGELRGAARDRCSGEPCSRRPIRVVRSNVAAVAAGFGHTCIRRTDDRVVCWGRRELVLPASGDVGNANSLLRSMRRVQAELRWRLGSFARWAERLSG